MVKWLIESQSGRDLGPRFIQSTRVRQRYFGVNKMTQGEISIGFNGLTKPSRPPPHCGRADTPRSRPSVAKYRPRDREG